MLLEYVVGFQFAIVYRLVGAECPYIETPRYGRVVNSPTYLTHSVIEFACNPGYDMDGQGTLRCRIDSEWDPATAPDCQPKNCGQLGDIPNSQVFQPSSQHGDNHYGSRIRVTCSEDYELSGNQYVECREDGTWSSKPMCLQMTCPPYPGLTSSCIANSIFQFNNLYITCDTDPNKSVTKRGGSSAECRDSSWNRLDLACYCDCEIQINPNAAFRNLNDKGFLEYDVELQWNCMPGYQVNVTVPKCNDGRLIMSNDHVVDQTLLCVRVPTTSAAPQAGKTSTMAPQTGPTSTPQAKSTDSTSTQQGVKPGDNVDENTTSKGSILSHSKIALYSASPVQPYLTSYVILASIGNTIMLYS